MSTTTDNAMLSQFLIVKSRFDELLQAARTQRMRSQDLEYQCDLMQNALDALGRRIRDAI